LVDDDPDVRSIAAAMLSDAGYEVVEAASGATALDMLERADSQTELVVADVVMPGLNGVELAAIIRRTWPTLPVLLMTGYADSRLVHPGATLDLLRKPFQAAELEAKVQQTIMRSRRASAERDPTRPRTPIHPSPAA